MSVGEKNTINISHDDAYGPINDEALIEFPQKNVPPDMPLEAGMQLELNDENGQSISSLSHFLKLF